ncbi:MAG: hypothetical protein E6G56_13580 [Actinobacteria bacterium]|nr:MAG: hypothetical protein E6G56_13580 [Actinomycetota bacterium]
MTSFELSHKVVSATLHVRLASGEMARRLSLDCVVDLTGTGDVVGVEILDFRRQLRDVDVPDVQCSNGHSSYDPEMDAFYLRLGAGPAPVQKKTSGIALVDSHAHVLGLEVGL